MTALARVLVALLLACLLAPALAKANAAKHFDEGILATEPQGLIDVAILHETLTLDLRRITVDELAAVEAVYRLDNRGGTRRLELVFAGGSDIAAFQARLDGQAVGSRRVPVAPETWPPPPTVPAIGGGTRAHFVDPPEELPVFAIELPPGEHELVVRYEGKVASDRKCSPTRCWTFAYLLAPARQWAEFGGLEATILVPEGWEIAVEPAFERTGDVLHASFTELPADVIGMTIQAPVGGAYWLVVLATWLLFALATCGGGWVCLRAGRLWHGLCTRVVPVLVVLVLPFAVGAAGLSTVLLPRSMLDPRQAPNHGYDDLWPILVALGSFPVGVVLAIVGARRSAPREDG